jgi:hypothetical protein
MGLQEMSCEKMNWIKLDQNCDHWQASFTVHMMKAAQVAQSVSRYLLNWNCKYCSSFITVIFNS